MEKLILGLSLVPMLVLTLLLIFNKKFAAKYDHVKWIITGMIAILLFRAYSAYLFSSSMNIQWLVSEVITNFMLIIAVCLPTKAFMEKPLKIRLLYAAVIVLCYILVLYLLPRLFIIA